MNRHSKRSIWGIVIIIIGVLFLLDSLKFVEFEDIVSDFWPLALIIIGLLIIFKKRNKETVFHWDKFSRDSHSGIPGLAGDIHIAGLADGVGIIDRSLLFGDITIDLADSKLNDGDNIIDVSVLFGEVKIRIPRDFPKSLHLKCFAGKTSFDEKISDGLMPEVRHIDNNFENLSARLIVKVKAGFGEIMITSISK